MATWFRNTKMRAIARACFALLLIGILLSACASSPDVVGSRTWHAQRIAEIDTSYNRGDLSEEEYLRLKNEADNIRAERRGGRSSVSLGVGFISH